MNESCNRWFQACFSPQSCRCLVPVQTTQQESSLWCENHKPVLIKVMLANNNNRSESLQVPHINARLLKTALICIHGISLFPYFYIKFPERLRCIQINAGNVSAYSEQRYIGSSVFTPGFCFYCWGAVRLLSCNQASILHAAGVPVTQCHRLGKWDRGHQLSSHAPPPPPDPALMVEGLRGLTAALKLESRREHHSNEECLDCLDCLSLPPNPGKMAAAKLNFLSGCQVIQCISA